MSRWTLAAGVGAFAVMAAGQASAASIPFTITPGAVFGAAASAGPLTIANLVFANDSTVVFTGPAGPVSNFNIQGFLPVTGYAGASDPKLDVAGGYGLYFKFTGAGTQSFVPTVINGQTVLPGAYTSLNYSLFGFAEPASGLSGFGVDGVTITNPGTNTTLLGTGSLITVGSTASITNGVPTADLLTAFSVVAPTFFGTAPGVLNTLEFQLANPASSITQTASGLTINGGAGTAAFVPEPASLALLGFGLAGLAGLRRRAG